MWTKLLMVFSLTVWVVGVRASAAVPYQVVQIPTPYGGLSNVMDINELGHVAYWGGGSYAAKAYLWDGSTATCLPAGGASLAYKLNDSGVAVGYTGDAKASMWSGGVLTVLDLGSLNSSESFAYAINNAGLIAGKSLVSGSGMHLYTMDPSGTVTDHGTLPSYYHSIVDMNESGQIVMLDAGPGTHGYVWQNGIYTPLYDLEGGIYSEVHAINEAGLVVGASRPHQMNSKAVCWQDGQIVRVLPVPQDTTAGYACGVNNLGQIVGWYSTPDLGRRACLWDVDGLFYDLTDLVVGDKPGYLNYARDINDAGQIAIWGQNETGYVLTPIPEPTTLSLLALGGLALLRRKRASEAKR